MKTISVFLLGLFLICSTSISATGDIKNKIKGKWTVQVPDAPHGSQNYVMDVKLVDGEYKADIAGSGLDLKNQKLIEKDNKLKTQVYAGEYIDVTIWEENDTIKGLADTSMGKLPIIFSKKK